MRECKGIHVYESHSDFFDSVRCRFPASYYSNSVRQFQKQAL